MDAELLPCGTWPCPTTLSRPWPSSPVPRRPASSSARMARAKNSDAPDVTSEKEFILHLSAKIERWCLTTGLRQTFVPPLYGRDSAAQPERYVPEMRTNSRFK